MGDTRGTRALLAMVLVLVGGLLTVGSAPAASAAGPFPDQCVESRSGESVRFESAVPLQDLDVQVWLGGREIRGSLYLVNGRDFQGGQRWILTDQFNRLGNVGSVTFDNQAALGYDDVPPTSGDVRVRPKQALPQDWGSSDYAFYVDSGTATPSMPIVVTVAWSDCDEDRDARGDRTGDNCVGLFNPDQADLDRDGRGDPCDADDDNDGVADTGDNCPRIANADQADWDGDRTGNACDASPGVAPPPPSTTPAPPGTVSPPPGCSVGCAYVRTVGLRHQASRHRLTGTVDSVAVGCRAGVEVTLWRKRSGDDRKLVVMTSRSTGKFRTRAPRRAGRYYVTVGSPDQPLCASATSATVRVRRA